MIQNYPESPIVGAADPNCTLSGDRACSTGISSLISKTTPSIFASGVSEIGLTTTPSLPLVTLTVHNTKLSFTNTSLTTPSTPTSSGVTGSGSTSLGATSLGTISSTSGAKEMKVFPTVWYA